MDHCTLCPPLQYVPSPQLFELPALPTSHCFALFSLVFEDVHNAIEFLQDCHCPRLFLPRPVHRGNSLEAHYSHLNPFSKPVPVNNHSSYFSLVQTASLFVMHSLIEGHPPYLESHIEITLLAHALSYDRRRVAEGAHQHANWKGINIGT